MEEVGTTDKDRSGMDADDGSSYEVPSKMSSPVLRYSVLRYSVLRYSVLRYSVLRYSVLRCSVLSPAMAPATRKHGIGTRPQRNPKQ
jgi:hypothetical protein